MEPLSLAYLDRIAAFCKQQKDGTVIDTQETKSPERFVAGLKWLIDYETDVQNGFRIVPFDDFKKIKTTKK